MTLRNKEIKKNVGARKTIHLINGTITNYRDEMRRITDSMLNIFHLNIRNANKNMDQSKLIFTCLDEKADIIIMTETWCDESQAKTLNLGFKGYETLWSKTKYNQNGGIGIAIRNGISYNEKDSRTYKFEADALIIEIKGKTEENNYLIVALYRNPSRDINIFIIDFETFLSHENKRKGKMVIIGDMNININ